MPETSMLMELAKFRDEMNNGYYDQSWINENVEISCKYGGEETKNVRVKEAEFYLLSDHLLGIKLLIELNQALKLDHEICTCKSGVDEWLVVRFYGNSGGKNTTIKIAVKKGDFALYKLLEKYNEVLVTGFEPYDNKILIHGIYVESTGYAFMKARNANLKVPLIEVKEKAVKEQFEDNEKTDMREILEKLCDIEDRLDIIQPDIELLHERLDKILDIED